jgi:hypothetical protein
MKLHVLLALAGLTTGLTLPALAQQEEPPLGEQDYQKLVELGKKTTRPGASAMQPAWLHSIPKMHYL